MSTPTQSAPVSRRGQVDVPAAASSRARGPARARVPLAVAAALAVSALLVAATIVVLDPQPDDGAEYVIQRTLALDFADADTLTATTVGGEWQRTQLTAVGSGSRMTLASPAGGVEGSASLLVENTDVVVRAAIARAAESLAPFDVGVAARSDGADAYRLVASIGDAASLRLERTGTDPRPLAEVPLPVAPQPGQVLTLELRAVGDSVVQLQGRAWIDGVLAPVSVFGSDATPTRLLAGRSLGLTLGAAGGPASAELDSFAAFEVRGADPVPASPFTAPVEDAVPTLPVAAGALEVGTARYAIPTGAVIVAPGGRDDGAGTVSDPLATLARAVEVAAPGATVVLRAGVYHEAVTMPARSYLTIQAAPGEPVWLDGSSEVTGWVASGAVWVSDGWTTAFDTSPTYTRGAPDGTTPGWSFVNPAFPLAAHPDQLWIDDAPLIQVGSAEAVIPGTFFVDVAASRLLVGSDPTASVVRASDLVRALSLRSTHAAVKGIGVRRFSPSVPDLGAVRVESAAGTIENVVIDESATTGLFVRDRGTTVSHTSVTRSGMLGVAGSYADELTLSSLLVADGNTENFNQAPVSGGIKVTRSRGVDLLDSVVEGNAGPGVWFDESVYDGVVAGSRITDNAGHGISLEISSTMAVVDNLIARNAQNGIKVNDTDHVRIWNNTFTENGRTINIVQDARRAADRSVPGHDPRQEFPDPTMTWVIADVTVANNVLAASTGKCLLCVEDYSKQLTAAQMGIVATGNVYQRADAAAPAWLVVWSRGAETNPAVYTSLLGFQAATGQEATGLELTGLPALGVGDILSEALGLLQVTVAQPLPADLAVLVGQPAGARALGAFPPF